MGLFDIFKSKPKMNLLEDYTFAHKNVVFKDLDFDNTELPEKMSDFYQEVADANLTPAGDFFFAVKEVPDGPALKTRFFLPIKESGVAEDNALWFNSYIYLPHCVMQRYEGDFKVVTRDVYNNLFDFIKKHGKSPRSDMYNRIHIEPGLTYVETFMSLTIDL